MRALFVAPYLPTPGSGGRTRLINLMERLSAEHDLSLVAFAADDQADDEGGYPGTVLRPPPRRPRPGGTRGLARFYREKLERLPAYAGWMRSPEMARAIAEAIERFQPDVVQVETTEMAQYLDVVPRRILRALDLQDVASRWFAHTVAKQDQTPQQRAMMRVELAKTRRYERRAARLADVVFATSPAEREALRAIAGVDAVEVPNGVDTRVFSPMPAEPEDPDGIVFVGPLTYDANIDGVRWFCREVFPTIRRAVAGARLDVVGTPLEEDFGDGVTLRGRVEDVRPFVARAPVSVVPVRLGSGTRYKILEALSMERAVVSTTLGADGLGVRHDEHVLLADDPRSFADAVVALLGDATRRRRLGVEGRRFVAGRYDWGLLVDRVAEAWAQARRA